MKILDPPLHVVILCGSTCIHMKWTKMRKKMNKGRQLCCTDKMVPGCYPEWIYIQMKWANISTFLNYTLLPIMYVYLAWEFHPEKLNDLGLSVNTSPSPPPPPPHTTSLFVSGMLSREIQKRGCFSKAIPAFNKLHELGTIQKRGCFSKAIPGTNKLGTIYTYMFPRPSKSSR